MEEKLIANTQGVTTYAVVKHIDTNKTNAVIKLFDTLPTSAREYFEEGDEHLLAEKEVRKLTLYPRSLILYKRDAKGKILEIKNQHFGFIYRRSDKVADCYLYQKRIGITSIKIHTENGFSIPETGFYNLLLKWSKDAGSFVFHACRENEEALQRVKRAIVSLFHYLEEKEGISAQTLDFFNSLCSKYLPESRSYIDIRLESWKRKGFTPLVERIRSLMAAGYDPALLVEAQTGFDPYTYALWLLGCTGTAPIPQSQAQVDCWKFVVATTSPNNLLALTETMLLETPRERQTVETVRFLLSSKIRVQDEEELEDLIHVLSLIPADSGIVAKQENFETDGKHILTLWRRGIIETPAAEWFYNYLSTLTETEAEALFLDLPAALRLKVVLLFPEKGQYKRLLESLISQKFHSQPITVLDLESDGNLVREAARTNGTEIVSYFGKEGAERLVTDLSQSEITVVAGHNITAFDLPVLQRQGVSWDAKEVIDTLLLEVFLNPLRNSYALRTAHTAEADVRVTAKLLQNQIGRLCLLPAAERKLLKPLLPDVVKRLCGEVLSLMGNDRPEEDIFEEEAGQTFQQANAPLSLPDNIAAALVDSAGSSWIVPKSYHSHFPHSVSVLFPGRGQDVLDEAAVAVTEFEDPWLTLLLRRYMDGARKAGQIPTVSLMPAWLQMQLGTVLPNLCLSPAAACLIFSDSVSVYAPEEAHLIPENSVVTLVAPEETQLLLLARLSIEEVFSCLMDNPLWLRLSGGQCHIALDPETAKKLGVSPVGDVQNLWLERAGDTSFCVWASVALQSFLTKRNIVIAARMDWPEDEKVSPELIIYQSDKESSTLLWEVNPESFYRQQYWTYCAKLIGSALGFQRIVLIAGRPEEIPTLNAYFRKLGYYIPHENAGLLRRVTLLTQSGNKSLLIVSESELNRLTQLSIAGPLCFIWDSLNLGKAQMLLETKPQEDDDSSTAPEEHSQDSEGTNGVRNPDETEEDGLKRKSPVANDIFKATRTALATLQPTLKSLAAQNKSHRFCLLDARFAAYPNRTIKGLKLSARKATLWKDDEAYKEDLKFCSGFFPASAASDYQLTNEEAQELLQKVFLPQGDWRDYQREYLKNILPHEKHFLITLPTGGGKSLLFQGPALLRYAYTGRLSLVVTPLKALMKDQVETLWEKHRFYSSVDYISGDRPQSDLKQVLRKVAGGEIGLLYITPERFRSRAFRAALATRLMVNGGQLEYFIFDEAHCISQWGHEFRPDYLNGFRFAKELLQGNPNALRLLLLSATISEQVFADLKSQVEAIERLATGSYNPVRDHIQMSFSSCLKDEDRMQQLIDALNTAAFNPAGSRALVFTPTRKMAEESAALLRENIARLTCLPNTSYQVGFYHAGMDDADRASVYKAYKESSEMPIIFATKAFGMGVDIGNIHHLFHFRPPSAFEDFLQEVGRAGRDEESRQQAGFKEDRRIEAITFLTEQDFRKIKTQLKQSGLPWTYLPEVRKMIEDYLKETGILIPEQAKKYVIPLDLASRYSLDFKEQDGLDTRFRLSLHWLEKLSRIQLGMFALPELPVKLRTGVNPTILPEGLQECAQLVLSMPVSGKEGLTLVNLSRLSAASQGAPVKALEQLCALQAIGFLTIERHIAVAPTQQRLSEYEHYHQTKSATSLVGLCWAFRIASAILEQVPFGEEKSFDGEMLDELAKSVAEDCLRHLPVEIRDNPKKLWEYKVQLFGRMRHVFMLIGLIPGIRHKSNIRQMTETVSGKRAAVEQLVYNGVAKKGDIQSWLLKMEKDCMAVCQEVFSNIQRQPNGLINWADLVNNCLIDKKPSRLEEVLLFLRTMGYLKGGGSLLPGGIEVTFLSEEPLQETNSHHADYQVYEEFLMVGKVRQLKLIALQAMAELEEARQDAFIKGYFAAKTYDELLSLLKQYLPGNDQHPALKAFGEEALLDEEKRLNNEQRQLYEAPLHRHSSVLAGPGSGKTHTLMMRVARLIQKEDVSPADIVVLAYNRAVVTELKKRLLRLFRDLGYEDITRPLLIATFHELALRVNPDLQDKPFNEWEPDLKKRLDLNPLRVKERIGRVQYLLVDEFQDATFTRIEILKGLCQLSNGKLFAIGDPNQSIYGYERGAVGDPIGPKSYYDKLNSYFKPDVHYLSQNHRSLPRIVEENNDLIKETLAEFEMPALTTKQKPFTHTPEEYCVVKDHEAGTFWTDDLKTLLGEKGEGGKSYKQIAVLFRSNDELFRGWDRILAAGLKKVRIRLQGSLPVSFGQLREGHHFMKAWEAHGDTLLPTDFSLLLKAEIKKLRHDFPGWDALYLCAMHALVLQFIEANAPESQPTYAQLCEFIRQSTRRDDGSLFKVYQDYKDQVDSDNEETEILLSTIHRVKGLEFDAVVVPPSFAKLPFTAAATEAVGMELMEEERRLLYVAYSRAKYRLCATHFQREHNCLNSPPVSFTPPAELIVQIGRPLKRGMKDVWLSWGARSTSFSVALQGKIKQLSKGTPVYLIGGDIRLEDGTQIGRLSTAAAADFPGTTKGFFVNEVVVRTFEEEAENFRNYWGAAAREQGWIYLVTISGFGKPV